ncbi:hypothetical protein Q427_00785 [Halomonas sp. BC04]|nr:hypothetical protein Q427_00785 [Halomonas sp. BC04]
MRGGGLALGCLHRLQQCGGRLRHQGRFGELDLKGVFDSQQQLGTGQAVQAEVPVQARLHCRGGWRRAAWLQLAGHLGNEGEQPLLRLGILGFFAVGMFRHSVPLVMPPRVVHGG